VSDKTVLRNVVGGEHVDAVDGRSMDLVDPSTGKGPEWGKAAPIGLLVILLLVIATFFLLRSMVRKINKVPASFDPPDEDAVDLHTVSPYDLGAAIAEAVPLAAVQLVSPALSLVAKLTVAVAPVLPLRVTSTVNEFAPSLTV